MRDALDRMWRRILLMIAVGKVSAGNNAGAVQLLQIVLNGLETQDKRPYLQHYGFESAPKPGADVGVAYIAGDRTNGFIIASGDQRYRLHVAEGEVAIYDDLGHKVHLTRAGIVIDAAGHNMTILNAPVVDMGEAQILCGSLIATTSVLAPTVTGTVDVVFGSGPTERSGIAHRHGNVDNGPDISGPPVV